MRLAEVKVRLLVFLAGKLLQWAGPRPPLTSDNLIVDVIDSDDDGSLYAGWSDDDVADDEPPEHWTRLIRTEPPEPWLDLFKDKTPQLLAPLDEDGLANERPEESERPGTQKQKRRGKQFLKVHKPTPLKTTPPRNTRPNRMNYPISYQARVWLNRLRFAKPHVPASEAEMSYVSHLDKGRNATEYQASGAPETSREELQPFFVEPQVKRPVDAPAENRPERSVRSQPMFSPPDDSTAARESEGAEGFAVLPLPSTRDSMLEGPATLSASKSRQAAPEYPETESRPRSSAKWFDSHWPRARTRRRESLPKPKKRTVVSLIDETRSRPVEEREPATLEIADSSPVNNAPARLRFNRVHQPRQDFTNPLDLQGAKSRRTGQARYVEPAGTRTRGGAERKHQARTEFHATTENAESSLAFNFGQNVWPMLPPEPTVDFSDEILTREAEVETARRLDQEQRGMPWNA